MILIGIFLVWPCSKLIEVCSLFTCTRLKPLPANEDGIKKRINIKKIKVGHAGTLDPLATGLLIVCTGKFTKKISEIQAAEKEYTGIITLGATTPCYDLEKEVDEEFPTEHITEQLIQDLAQ